MSWNVFGFCAREPLDPVLDLSERRCVLHRRETKISIGNRDRVQRARLPTLCVAGSATRSLAMPQYNV